MNSQNNVSLPLTQFNKLRRLSNSIETRSRYSTLDPDRFSEAVKLPALNSINRSVKYSCDDQGITTFPLHSPGISTNCGKNQKLRISWHNH